MVGAGLAVATSIRPAPCTWTAPGGRERTDRTEGRERVREDPGVRQTHSAQEIAAKMPADQVLQQLCDRWASCDSPRLLEHSRARAKQIARAVLRGRSLLSVVRSS